MHKKKILITPLDWGLGHATRCIPVIREVMAAGAEVVLAADGRPAELLRREFPELPLVRFPGYGIVYPVDGNMAWTMFRQLPKLYAGIAAEQRMLESIVDTWGIDAVISDNRWGAFSRRVPSIYIVHQLRILLSRYLRWGQWIVDRTNAALIDRFTEVWIPDVDSEDNFLGDLAPPTLRTSAMHFVGPLTRMQGNGAREKEWDILVILSGPEPQRTICEELLIRQLLPTSYTTLIVRGIPEQSERTPLSKTITSVSAMTADELTRAIGSARTVISRPGYSTVMDFSALGVNPIFIPTPQQTEQEFLADMLKQRNVCYSEAQSDFSLDRAMTEHRRYPGFTSRRNDYTILRSRIAHLLSSIA